MIGQVIAESQWERSRLGRLTASGIHVLLSEPKSKADKEAGLLSKGALTYINEKCAEILTGTVRQFSSAATEWGNEQEPLAIELLKKRYPDLEYFGNQTRKFFQYGKFAGGTPDAIDRRTLKVFEIKCPENPANHVQYLQMQTADDLKSAEPEYYSQIQMNIICVADNAAIPYEKLSGIFVSYCPLIQEEWSHLVLKELPIPADIELIERLKIAINKSEGKMREILSYLLTPQQ